MKKLKCANRKVIPFDETDIQTAMNQYAASVSNIFEKTTINGDNLFFASNIVGEYAELVACTNLDLIKEVASKKSFDAIGAKDGKTYQIKSRWMNQFGTQNGKNEFGRIKVKDIANIDYLVLVVFLGDDFANQELYTIDLKNDLTKIFDAYDKGDLSQKIVSLYGKSSSQEYIFKYYGASFAKAVSLGLMARTALTKPASSSPKNFDLKHLKLANDYLRKGHSLMKLESTYGYPDQHGNIAKRILNGMGIDTSLNGDKGALIGKTVSEELLNPGLNAKYRAVLEAIRVVYGD